MTEKPWYRWEGDALLIELTIQPGAASNTVAGRHGNLLKIRIQAPPVDGKANRALVEFLSREFATPRSRITIVKGETNRIKSIRIDQPKCLPAALQAIGLVAHAQTRK